jgi:hypothetical protein
MSLQTTKRISIIMCRFLIIKDLEGRIFRKGTFFCDNGMRGFVCIDVSKIYSPGNSYTLGTKTGDITTRTSTITSILLENLLQVTEHIIEIDVIAPYIDRFKTENIESLYSAYLILKKGGMYPSSVSSPSIYTVNSVESTIVSRSSQKKVRAPSTVAPTDSISQVSSVPSRRLNKIDENEKHSVAGWIERSSTVSVDSSKTHKSTKSPSTVRPPPAPVSIATSRASSRRGSSYAMGRQIAIRE